MTQKNRVVTVKSPLGEDVLLFRQMTAREELGRLSEFHLDLLSENEAVKMEDVLGKKITVKMALREGGERFFNGYVSRFAQVERVQGWRITKRRSNLGYGFSRARPIAAFFKTKPFPKSSKKFFAITALAISKNRSIALTSRKFTACNIARRILISSAA